MDRIIVVSAGARRSAVWCTQEYASRAERIPADPGPSPDPRPPDRRPRVVLSLDCEREAARFDVEQLQTSLPGAAHVLDTADHAALRAGRVRAGRVLGRPVRAGPEEESGGFVLYGGAEAGVRVGAHRNRLLLLNRGKRVLFTDDDEPPQFAFDPDTLHEPPLFDRPERHMVYRPSYEWSNLSGDLDVLLAAHERVLGGDPRHLSAGPVPDPAAPAVLATVTGYNGDLGLGAPISLLLQSGESGRRLRRAERESHDPYLSRLGRLGVGRTVLAASPLFRSGHCALDASRLLPPFPPGGRGQDLVFGVILTHMYGPGVVCHLPIDLKHLPKADRSFPADAFDNVPHRVNDIIVLALSGFDQRPADAEPAATLERLGEHLRHVGGMHQGAYRRYIRERHEFVTEALEARLERIREEIPAKARWFDRHVDELLAARRRLERSDAVGTATDLTPGGRGLTHTAGGPGSAHTTRTAGSTSAREYLRSYGRALSVWPRLWGQTA